MDVTRVIVGGAGVGGQRLVTSMDSSMAFQLRRFLEFLFANYALVVIVLAVLIHSVSFPYKGIPRGGVAAERVMWEGGRGSEEMRR